METCTATYSPEDNKLRLSFATRASDETCERMKAAGYRWAPVQQLWVAPMWTPEREDLALQLAGEIEDEDRSLVDRAEERADRFETYSESRAADADAAQRYVASIADGIPLGQPILVGHHSERRARKDAERIENGMRKAVRMWETSTYWTQRAAGAIRAAKYKERADVRARRIKGLESEQRKCERNRDTAALFLRMWGDLHRPGAMKKPDGTDATPMERALFIANRDHVSACFPAEKYPRPEGVHVYEGQISLWSALSDGFVTPEQARELAERVHRRCVEINERWLSHLGNRLAYERAMLAESGGTVADRTKPEKGGAVRCVWAPRGGWAYVVKVNRVSVTVLHSYQPGGRKFRQNVPLDKLRGVMTAADVEAARAAGRLVEDSDGCGFYLHAPEPESEPAPPASDATPDAAPTPEPAPDPRPVSGELFAGMRETLRQGVKVVVADQLFETPRELARRMVELADVQPGHRVLEPSAGTGALADAILGRFSGADCGRVVLVEHNGELARGLEDRRDRTLYANGSNYDVRHADFLTCNGDLGTFHRVVMNPPFKDAADVRHILHARHFLKPGGVLVAICANGPRQAAQLRPLAETWEELPAGTFRGTDVRAVLLTMRAEADAPATSADA